MQNKDFSTKVKYFLDEASKQISPELLSWIKKQFETNGPSWLGKNLGQTEINIVVDSNSVIRSMEHFAKGKTPLLLKLAKNPLFRIFAPTELEVEVVDYLNNKSKKSTKFKEKMIECWNKIKQILSFKKITNPISKETAASIIGNKDPKDVPFVAVYVDVGASAIVTDDKHFVHPSIHKFRIEEFGEIVGTFHRGMFSFFMMNDFVPMIFDIIKRIAMAIVKILSDILGIIFELAATVIGGSLNKLVSLLSRIPTWILVGIIGIAAIILIISDKTRYKVTNKLSSFWNKIKPILNQIMSIITKIMDSLLHYVMIASPYAGMSIIALEELHSNIKLIMKEFEELKSFHYRYYA